MENLIGKQFIPTDNSYSINLTTLDHCCYLAGTRSSDPIITTIINNPFQEVISIGVFKEEFQTNTFVLTKDEEGNIYKCLFDNRGFDVQNRIEDHLFDLYNDYDDFD